LTVNASAAEVEPQGIVFNDSYIPSIWNAIKKSNSIIRRYTIHHQALEGITIGEAM
jgi:hypothetical protein